jgi:hypothetical protein
MHSACELHLPRTMIHKSGSNATWLTRVCWFTTAARFAGYVPLALSGHQVGGIPSALSLTGAAVGGFGSHPAYWIILLHENL